MKKSILIVWVVVGLIAISCSKTDTSTSLKDSIERSAAKINNAISEISVTKGYELLTIAEDLSKSEISYHDSITLAMIAGIYDYSPDTVFYHENPFPRKLFKKTGISDNMIVNMPQKLVLHPRYMYNFYETDSALANNFTITATDYHFYYSWFHGYDYKLSAGLTLDQEDIGSLEIVSAAKRYNDFSYQSKYSFTEGYNIAVEFNTGDTTTSSFALCNGDQVLLKESRVSIKSKCPRDCEQQYTLTIGNVDIVRSSEIDSIQVFLDGVLQHKAAVKITDDSDTTGTICHHRDILLTFDDGTTVNLSELIGPALETLRTLVDSLHSMYFAKNIVDYIALNIYYHEYKMPYHH
jgi:archaellum component FlaG (FlaF/FlaG flagellin family)